MTAPGAIRIERVTRSFEEELVLNQIDLEVPPQSLTALLGPSGCGKTTLLRLAAGLLAPDTGAITLDGIPPAEAQRSGTVGFAFQAPTLLPWRSAVENVLLPQELLRRGVEKGDKARARDLLQLVDMAGEAGKYPRELSGGMQQRVGLARALVTEPKFLFLDEPFSALDGLTRDRLNEKVRKLWRTLNLTIMVVTHSVEEAVFLADRIVVLSRGPARVLQVVPIDLPADRDFTIRMTDEFFNLVRQVRTLTEEV